MSWLAGFLIKLWMTFCEILGKGSRYYKEQSADFRRDLCSNSLTKQYKILGFAEMWTICRAL